MTKSDLIKRVARVLNENNIKKKVHMEKRILKITDITNKSADESGQISIKGKDKEVRYTAEDVENVLEAIIACIHDTIAHGDQVTIKGIGTFKVLYHKGRLVRNPITNEMMPIPGRYNPKFIFSQSLKAAARLYELSMVNNPEGFKEPDPIYDRCETPDDYFNDTKDGDEVDGC